MNFIKIWKKIFREFIFIIYILSSFICSASFAYYEEKYERVWNNPNWPNDENLVKVYKFGFPPQVYEVWEIKEFQHSLDYLSLVNILPIYRDEKLNEALKNYFEAQKIFIDGEKFVKEKKLSASIDNLKQICELNIIECSCEISESLASHPFFPFILGVGIFIIPQKLVAITAFTGGYLVCQIMEGNGEREEIRRKIINVIFSSKYIALWKKTLNLAFDSLEEKLRDLNLEILRLEKNYEELKYAGFCEKEFGNCKEAYSLLETIRGNEFENKKAEQLHRELKLIREGINKKPIEVNISLAIQIIGNKNFGLISEVIETNKKLNEHKRKVEISYNILKNEIEEKKKRVRDKENEVIYHELELIETGGTFEEVISDKKQITHIIKEARRYVELAEEKEKNASIILTLKDRNYFFNSYKSLTETKYFLDRANDEFSKALSLAREIVNDEEKNARETIKNAEKLSLNVSSDSLNLLKESKKFLEKGVKENKLGKKYFFYQQAIVLAKEAEKLRDIESDVCKDLIVLFERSSKDSIDISEEKRIYEKIASAVDNKSYIVQTCQELKNSIFEKIKFFYGFLQEKRNNISNLLKICGEDCDDLRKILEREERGFVFNDFINWFRAVGNLKKLENVYEFTEKEIEKSLKNHLKKYLKINYELIVGELILNKPSVFKLLISIENPLKYEGKNLIVEVKNYGLNFEKIGEKSENIEIEESGFSNIKLKIKKILPGEKLYILLEKEFVPCAELSREKFSFALSDKVAIIEENISIECLINISNLEIEEKFDSVKVNGNNAYFENGRIFSRFLKGKNRVTILKRISDSYDITLIKNEITNIGNRVYVKNYYEIKSKVFLNLAEVKILFDQHAKDVRISVFENLKSLKRYDNYFEVRIAELRENQKIDVEISYYLENLSGVIEEETRRIIERIENEKANNTKNSLITDNISREIEEINNLYKNGNLTGAYEKILKIKRILEKAEDENKKKTVERDEILNKISNELKILDIEECGSFIEVLNNRANYLKELIEEVQKLNLDEQISKLKRYDNDWLETKLKEEKKKIDKEINNLLEKEEFQNLYELKKIKAEIDINLNIKTFCNGLSFIEKLKKEFLEKENKKKEEIESKKRILTDLKNLYIKVFDHYEKEYNSAKGTKFEDLFKVKIEEISNILKKIDNLNKGKERFVEEDFEERVKEIGEEVRKNLEFIKNRAENYNNLASSLLEASKNRLSEKKIKELQRIISESKEFLINDEYINSMKKLQKVFDSLEGLDKEFYIDSKLIVLLMIVFFVGGIIFYYIKLRKKQEKKEYRKLERIID